MASFPWLHGLRDLCSILRIFGEKKESKSFSFAQDIPEAAASLSTALDSVLERLELFTRALERLASDPGYFLTRKGASVQHPLVAFLWLQAL